MVYANVVKDDTGRSKGWGIVEFETPEEVRGAVAAHDCVRWKAGTLGNLQQLRACSGPCIAAT